MKRGGERGMRGWRRKKRNEEDGRAKRGGK